MHLFYSTIYSVFTNLDMIFEQYINWLAEFLVPLTSSVAPFLFTACALNYSLPFLHTAENDIANSEGRE